MMALYYKKVNDLSDYRLPKKKDFGHQKNRVTRAKVPYLQAQSPGNHPAH